MFVCNRCLRSFVSDVITINIADVNDRFHTDLRSDDQFDIIEPHIGIQSACGRDAPQSIYPIRSGVVASHCEQQALSFVDAFVGKIMPSKHRQILGACVHIIFQILDVGNAYSTICCRAWHDLHDTDRTNWTASILVNQLVLKSLPAVKHISISKTEKIMAAIVNLTGRDAVNYLEEKEDLAV